MMSPGGRRPKEMETLETLRAGEKNVHGVGCGKI
jgi:hypothetical protein